MSTQALLALLHLSSPSLPIGAFAYSQGLESAIEFDLVSDEQSLMDWLLPLLEHGQSSLDIPLLVRCYQAWEREDYPAVQTWQDQLLARRETAELVKEEQILGQTLYRLLQSLGVPLPAQAKQMSYLPLFAKAALHFGLDIEQAAVGWLWSWLDNQVTVACKTIPLGQTAAQRVLLAMMPHFDPAIQRGLSLDDTSIGLTLLRFSMLSSWHETQYSRLFRS